MEKKIIGKKTLKRIRDCEGPLKLNCQLCSDFDVCIDRVHWYTRIPHFITDHYIDKISPSAFKIFVFLSRKVNFVRKSNHYGRCWVTYEIIEKTTGIKASNMRKYMNELQDAKLIKHGYTHHKDSSGVFSTVHEVTITWYKRIDDLKRLKKKSAD